MSTKYNVIGYLEGEFQFDSGSYTEGSTIAVSLAPVMKLDKRDSNRLSLQMTVVYKMDDRVLMKYGGVVSYAVDGLKGLLEEKEVFDYLKLNIWNQTISFFRGIVCEKLRGTVIDCLFLPSLSSEQISEIPFTSV